MYGDFIMSNEDLIVQYKNQISALYALEAKLDTQLKANPNSAFLKRRRSDVQRMVGELSRSIYTMQHPGEDWNGVGKEGGRRYSK